jgi:hypothetical protein
LCPGDGTEADFRDPDDEMREVGAIRKAKEPRRHCEQRSSETVHHEMRSHRNDAGEAQVKFSPEVDASLCPRGRDVRRLMWRIPVNKCIVSVELMTID